jgi:hypothetical protein
LTIPFWFCKLEQTISYGVEKEEYAQYPASERRLHRLKGPLAGNAEGRFEAFGLKGK